MVYTLLEACQGETMTITTQVPIWGGDHTRTNSEELLMQGKLQISLF